MKNKHHLRSQKNFSAGTIYKFVIAQTLGVNSA